MAKNIPQDTADPQYIVGNLLRGEVFLGDIALLDRPANKNIMHAKCLLSHDLLPVFVDSSCFIFIVVFSRKI